MQLVNANPGVNPVASEPGSTRYNYILGNDRRKWASGLLAYRHVFYSDIYPATDLDVYLNESGVKYDFILHPGADPSYIKMKYEGAEGVKIINQTLYIKTSVGDLIEQAPVAWQIIKGERRPVECRFRLSNDGSIGFETGAYNPEEELIIDPQLIFATYSGSYADDWGFTATYDHAGNGYSAGIVFGGTLDFHVTPGAFQTTYGGGRVDIGILKYSSDGTNALYVTYLGGSQAEFPHSIIVNEYNELLLFGTTGSADFPVTSGAYSETFRGGPFLNVVGIELQNGSDIFICRLSSDGAILLSSTYVGGLGNDGLNMDTGLSPNYADEIRGALWVDANNNVYVGTSTQSADFPGTAGSYQPAYGGGNQDGIVLKLNGNLSRLYWATYLGGSDSDGIFYLTVDKNQQLVVTGGTRSSNFPVTVGAWKEQFGGGTQPDGFVSKLDSSGRQLLASSYVGTASYDQSYIVETDKTNHVYLFGQSSAGESQFIINTSLGTPGANQFILKMLPDFSNVVWSTNFGNAQGRPELSPTALLVDVCDKIYVTGWGGGLNRTFNWGTTGLPVTDNAFQDTTDGNDFYLYVINRQATAVEYASFLGGPVGHDHVDGGTSRFDRKGVVYQAVCGSCGGADDFPVTPNAYSMENNSSNCNSVLFKFDFESPIAVSSFILADASGEELASPVGCAPFSARFINTSINVESQDWRINGQPVSSDTNLSHTFTERGVYEVELIVYSSGSCNLSDTVSMTITILSQIEGALPEIKACTGTEVALGPDQFDDPYYTFEWLPETGLSDSKARKPLLVVDSTTEYSLVVSIGSCADTLSQQITAYGIHSRLPGLSLCSGDTLQLGTGLEAEQNTLYQWGPAEHLSDSSILQPEAFPPAPAQYRLTVLREQYPCPDTLDQEVYVTNGILSILPAFSICRTDTGTIGLPMPYGGDVRYSWDPALNLNDTSIYNPVVTGDFSREYQLSVIIMESCADTFTQQVTVAAGRVEELPGLSSCRFDSVQIGFPAPLPGATGYIWEPSEPLSNASVFNPRAYADSSRSYRLLVSYPNLNCYDTLYRFVESRTNPFEAGPDTVSCNAEPVPIGNSALSPDYLYSWTPSAAVSDPASPVTIAQVEETTLFTLSRQPRAGTPGCPGQDGLTVSVYPRPVAEFSYELYAGCEGLTAAFDNSSTDFLTNEWQFGDGTGSSLLNPVVAYSYGDTLNATLISLYQGCADTTSVKEALKSLYEYYKENDSNVFSPNGDGINDCFSPALQYQPAPYDIAFLACSELVVYNRWGELMFSSLDDDRIPCWDGTSRNGNALPEGVYFYRYLFDGKERAGSVHLRRE